jgi:aryl-phospho-beta-D-glucosidase BglC (GH1 family)
MRKACLLVLRMISLPQAHTGRRKSGHIKLNILLPFYVLALCCLLIACKKDNSTKTPTNTNYTTDSSFKIPLSKGINLSNWFNDYSDPSQFSDRFTDAHFALLKQLGFTYVRIPIGQYILFNHSAPSQLNPVNLAYVESAVQHAINHGLAVTLNYHTASDDFEKTLPTNTVNQDKLAEYWKAVADYFKKYNKTQVFFEVYNEPHVASNGSLPNVAKTWWPVVQLKLVNSIRSVTPDHFIIVGGEGWNGIDGLLSLTPYRVDNIIYNFHFYDPFTFTHQGASWAGPVMEKLRDVPYPSTPENVAPIADTTSDPDAKQLLQWYGDERWNREKLTTSIQRAVDWANRNHAAVICNEFGSYSAYAPRQSRLDLIRDIRSILEENHIGWAMWEMDEGFGFINYNGNDRTSFTTDDEVLMSLGLK